MNEAMMQSKAPLFDQLRKHVANNPVSFHVPGHKNGTIFFEDAANFYRQILSIDVTEITGMDDLHHPAGVIREAEVLTQQLYRSDESHFLIGGSTVGNLAAILGTVKKGEKILIQRNSHQSVFHAVELADAHPVYLNVEIDENTGLSLGVSLETLKCAIEKYKDAKGVVLTNPTYEGYSQDLSEHIRLAHDANMVVIVDEAHGAHLLFKGDRWPKTALKAGADVVVQSAHKMLPAMTMTSFIHMKGEHADFERIRRYLMMLQSSSPSYPLMASLDVARAYLQYMLEDENEINLTEKLFRFRMNIGNGSSWRQSPQKMNNYIQDPLKLAIIPEGNVSSFAINEKLEESHLYAELVTPTHVLLTLPLTNDEKIFHRMEKSLMDVLHNKMENIEMEKKRDGQIFQEKESISEAMMLFSQLDSLPKERIKWEKSEGKIAAETITPYPPGIPVIVRGEKITAAKLNMLKMIVTNKLNLQTGNEWIEKGILVVNIGRNEEK